jgi:PHD/YefM family antitoxin component YafN of YafNO toxin-antitoxin module
MLATDSDELLRDFNGYCDKLAAQNEIAVIGRPDGKNLVLLTLDEYNRLLKEIYTHKKNG